ncbi:hypothetical protein O181_063345 [Austropuccinia psidii MF-1]|uniref:Uncharacterized protein n=1 Tax=Austropuccinia psidii MF-1 TaxID=1389203 RepID=A0A9Q3I252_9BASI|nr:hypothetical protein [Austropuccinia psidii MF-1]
MPIQHSPPARQTRSQAVLTSTPRAPLYGTLAVPQLRATLDRGPILEGAAPSRKEGRGSRRSKISRNFKDCFQMSWGRWQRGGGEFYGRGRF